MQPETRRASLTKIETALAADVPAQERRETLADLAYDHRPDLDTVAAVIPLLAEADDGLRVVAEIALARWGQAAVTGLMNALRSCQPLEVPLRLAIIRQLARLGPTAARAETLLRSLKDDADVGQEAETAIRAIRRDADDLIRRFGLGGVELLVLSLVVAAPMMAIRRANPNHPWPPLGLVLGVGALAVAGLMLARYQFSGDVLPDADSDAALDSTRWKLYGYLVVIGVIVGCALGVLLASCGGLAQGLFGK